MVDCHHGDVSDHGDHGGGGDPGDVPCPCDFNSGLGQQPRPNTDPALGNVTVLQRSKLLHEIISIYYNINLKKTFVSFSIFQKLQSSSFKIFVKCFACFDNNS